MQIVEEKIEEVEIAVKKIINEANADEYILLLPKLKDMKLDYGISTYGR